MSSQKYSIKGINEDHSAKAIGRSLPISTKQSVEVCSFIRNRNLQKAKGILAEVVGKKRPVPYKRYNRSMGHKPGNMSVGRYPVNTCKHILALLESVEANAQSKGLNTANLAIVHICPQKASKQVHYGRQRGTIMKRTHIEVVVEEKAEKKKLPKEGLKEPTPSKEAKLEEKKAESKQEPTKQKEVPKTEEKKQEAKMEAPKEEPKAKEVPKPQKEESKPEEEAKK